MGQNHIENNIYNGIKIDKDLNNLMEQEKNFLNNKNDSKKLNDLIKRNIGNNFNRSNFKNIFNRNENGFKNISEILNTIYDNNIYKEQITKANRSIYEVMFDVRDSLELRADNNNKNDLRNKIDLDKVNKKINNNMQSLINKTNIVNNNSSLNNFNYENDTQKNEINIYQNNNIYPNENQIYSTVPINKNIELKQKENLQKENLYFNNKKKTELILPKHNYKNINQTKPVPNKYLNTNNVFEDINKNKTKNIKTINDKSNNNLNKDIFHNNINYQEINQFNNIGNINHNKVNNFFILNNKNQNKDFYIIENDLPKKLINNNINTKKIEKDLNDENNNNYIYNKKNIIQKKIPLNPKTIKSRLYQESKTPSPKKYYDYNDLKKENEVTMNYSEKKQKTKNSLFKNDIICKNQEIFIAKSPVKNKKENNHRKNLFSEQITRKYFTIINENNVNNNKESSNSLNSRSDDKIQNDIILNQELNKIGKNNTINKQNLNIKEKTTQNKYLKFKEKTAPKKRRNKHLKMPKKPPVANIVIDLKGLIKLETMEKTNKNYRKVKEKSKPKKSKRIYDYPEDLKYNVFGKQYTFSFKDK